MFLQNLRLDYDPYPIGVINPVLDAGLYKELLKTFPPIELFKFMPRFGNKYSLSEKNNRKSYEDYIAQHRPWRELHDYVKSHDFIFTLLERLAEGKIHLGIQRKDYTLAAHWKRIWKNIKRGRLPVTVSPIYSRFEFSVLPAKGGIVTPHTDAPRKFITLVITMTDGDDWNPAWGGGTDILAPLDKTESFNFMNRALPYDACQQLRTVAFLPNQAMLFIKTFNSLHGVREMTGPEGALRRTLTINIERDY